MAAVILGSLLGGSVLVAWAVCAGWEWLRNTDTLAEVGHE